MTHTGHSKPLEGSRPGGEDDAGTRGSKGPEIVGGRVTGGHRLAVSAPRASLHPAEPGLPLSCRKLPGNSIQGLPGSGKIWVLGGAKNTVWQPLPPGSGILLLPSYPPTPGKTSTGFPPRPHGLWARKHPSPHADAASPPQAASLSHRCPCPQPPAHTFPGPTPQPWVPRAPPPTLAGMKEQNATLPLQGCQALASSRASPPVTLLKAQ